MEIKIIDQPTRDDLTRAVDFLNPIFIPISKQSFDADYLITRSEGKKDLIQFEIYDQGILLGLAIGIEKFPGYYHLWHIAVDKNARGKGIATRLYSEIEKFAKEHGYVGVTINTFNIFKDNLRLAFGRDYKIYDLEEATDQVRGPKILLKRDFGSELK